MKNDYAKRLRERKNLEYHVCRQLMADAALIAAAKLFGIGPKRAAAFHTELEKTYTEMAQLQQSDTPDMEYTKEVIDRRLREIVGPERFQPWDERYSL